MHDNEVNVYVCVFVPHTVNSLVVYGFGGRRREAASAMYMLLWCTYAHKMNGECVYNTREFFLWYWWLWAVVLLWIVATRHQMAKVLKVESIGNAHCDDAPGLLLPKFFYIAKKKL